jgi:hypothetical protein
MVKIGLTKHIKFINTRLSIKILEMKLHIQSSFKSIGKRKKNTYFIKKSLWSHFWIDFNKFYTKTFGIIYILFVYLLIMFIWAFVMGKRPSSVRPSVSFSHLNLLLWNRWTDFNQICQKCSLDGPLPDLCFWCVKLSRVMAAILNFRSANDSQF